MALDDDFGDWLAHGQAKGWISDLVCTEHDGIPHTDADYALMDDGLDDPCVPVVRLFGTEGPSPVRVGKPGRKLEWCEPEE